MAIEHVIPISLGGETILTNLVLACYRCNEFKGNRIRAIDSETLTTAALFDPLRQSWNEHFEWIDNNLRMMGKTATGRATIDALRMNNEWLMNARKIWIAAGLHPPLE